MPINEKYSYKSFKRQSFVGVSPAEFNGMEIVGSCFYQEEPFSDVFPPAIAGVVFTRCNLDNCNIPAGAAISGGTNKHYKSQNDGEYWMVDRDKKPTSPRDPDVFDACGISKSPADIPKVRLNESITYTRDPKRVENIKLDNLKSNEPRLKEVLVEDGELPIIPGVNNGNN